ncbi:MAG: hypothetical protein IT445_20450 [Phycisphaeraceae bacterium]|nr:hypothetical protein [Phycisphaeraceae bacterium]
MPRILLTCCALAFLICAAVVRAGEPIDIGDRLELLVDDYLIDSMTGAQLRLHEPIDRGPAIISLEKPSESIYMGYVTVIKDADTYRMYYRGDGSLENGTYCYAESPDGIHWQKPDLGLHEYEGSTQNNIVLMGRYGSHSFAPFLDANPDATLAQRYKALGLLRTEDNKRWHLVAFASPDGIHWQLMQEEPVMTEGAFDSQNVVFWSQSEKRYVCYYRTKSKGDTGLRQISRAVSDDYLNWSDGVLMEYVHDGELAPFEQMYINQTTLYFRAPHIYIATAARFMQGRRAPGAEMIERSGIAEGKFRDCSDPVLMTTRGDNHYARTFMDGWIRPGIGLQNWTTRSNYPACGIVPTSENEMSIYVVQAYGQPQVRIERFSMRLDGFISVNAPYDGGEMITRTLRCPGGNLVLNYSTSAAGQVQVEFLDEAGQPILGFSAGDCRPMIGNEIEGLVTWRTANDLSTLKGRAVKLRLLLKDADVYSLQFVGIENN